jgi:lipopolysaccharide export system permease protein
MTVIQRYLLAQITRPMVATVLVALLVLLAERMLRVVDLVIGWRGSLLVVFEMLSFLVPHYMALAVPAAFFIGILLTVGRFSREGELDAMMASGNGLPQLVRPLLAMSLGIVVFNLLMVSYVQPYSRYAYRVAVQVVTNASFQQLLRPNVFTTLGNTTSMAAEISDDKRHFQKVFLYSQGQNGDQVTITANSGELARRGPTDPVTIDLTDGVHQVVPLPPADKKDQKPDAIVAKFHHFETIVTDTRENAPEPRGADERELTLPELYGYLGTEPPPRIRPFEIASEFTARLVRSLSIPLLPLVAVPLSLGRRRSQGSYGLAVGLALLIAYNQVIGFGESMSGNDRIGTFVGLWLPFALFACFSVWLFLRAALRVPALAGASRLERGLDWLVERGSRLLGITRASAR